MRPYAQRANRKQNKFLTQATTFSISIFNICRKTHQNCVTHSAGEKTQTDRRTDAQTDTLIHIDIDTLFKIK